MIKIISTATLFLFIWTSVLSQNLRLKVEGDDIAGYTVNLYNGSKLLLKNSEELSLEVANLDLSEVIKIPDWRASEWEGDENWVRLSKETYLSDLDLNVLVTVTYEVLNKNVVKKTVDLLQSGMPTLYYKVEETSRPAETPLKYITFEQDNFPGGLAHEIFPSAGFVTSDKVLIGFLMDAGYKNHYTRSTRRRFNGHGGGFVGMRKLPDPALVSVSTTEERGNNQHYIKQTFGEMYNLDAGETRELELREDFRKIGILNVEEDNDDKVYHLHCQPQGRCGIEMLMPMKNQQVYTISFLAKGDSPIALKLFRNKNGEKTVELEHGIKYIDNFPIGKEEWTLFEGSVLVPYIEKDTISMFIGSQTKEKCHIQIKELKVVEHQPRKQPYNKMNMGERVSKTTFVFAEPWVDHLGFVRSSQLRLAEGLGFEGSMIEKMLYANLNMLTWITSVNDFTPLNVPNMNYAPDMYNRDAFFSVISSYDKELSVSIWEQWAKTQNSKGAIATIITPYMGTIEMKDNEATIHFLIWAMLNKRRFGVSPSKEKIDKAVEYVLKEFDADGDGICSSHYTLSQIDVNQYHPKTSNLAVNQGIFSVALRVIKELEYDISDAYIRKAEQAYRDFYDTERKHLIFDRDFPEIITLTDLEPEFFSLWLFDRPILTDEMVVNHLEQIPILNKNPAAPYPELGTTAPICVRLTADEKGYKYLTSDYQPFREFGEANYKDGSRDGFYYNGGSWMRAEYCAYVVGLRHGWVNAEKLMENRIWAELNLNPQWSYSKEFIPTKWETLDSWWPSTRGLCWNVFILMANEVAGIRTPSMDPNHE